MDADRALSGCYVMVGRNDRAGDCGVWPATDLSAVRSGAVAPPGVAE